MTDTKKQSDLALILEKMSKVIYKNSKALDDVAHWQGIMTDVAHHTTTVIATMADDIVQLKEQQDNLMKRIKMLEDNFQVESVNQRLH